MQLSEVHSLADYLKSYGPALASKAIQSLQPLHVPGRDPLPDFSGYLRQPYEAQGHLVAAAGKMFDESGGGFIVGEMGTGKTIAAIVAVDVHAAGAYRSIVVCPDHLIAKWEREIRKTIRDVDVETFDRWQDFMRIMPTPTPSHEPKRWSPPERATWLVAGRDQIKRCAGVRPSQQTKRIVVDEKAKKDERGNVKYLNGHQVMTNVIEERIVCPRCGAMPNERGIPIPAEQLANRKHRCQAMTLQQLPGELPGGLMRLVDHQRTTDRDVRTAFPREVRRSKAGDIISHAGVKWLVGTCDEPLWQYTHQPKWWPPARMIKSRLDGWADYLIIDEAHEQQSKTSAQSMAVGKVLSCTKYVLALTGTFINGRADHLFPLFMRMAPHEIKQRGFEWGQETEFAEQYGCIDRIVSSKATVSRGGAIRSMRKVESSSTRKAIRPGIMPALFPEIVMPRAMFLKLEDFIDDLPHFEDPPTPLPMHPEVAEAYADMEAQLKEENGRLLSTGNMKLLGTTLHSLLGYPDYPWDWTPMFDGTDPETGRPYHAIGWWRTPKVYTPENFVGVYTPKSFPDDIVLPKEEWLADRCVANRDAGDQTWVYVQMTGKRDLQPRLQKLLEARGLRVGILRTGASKLREREQWIDRNGHLFDVMLSHPKLVATGMDLFSFDSGNHNYNRLIFYQTGYELSVLRQASRRSWRLGQPKDCSAHFLYCTGSSQAVALNLMGLKMAAAKMLEEGSVSDEGLAAMGSGGSEQAALVKRLGEVVNPAEIQRNWGRVRSRPKLERTDVPAARREPRVPVKSPTATKPPATKPKPPKVKSPPATKPIEAPATIPMETVAAWAPDVTPDDELVQMFRRLRKIDNVPRGNWEW